MDMHACQHIHIRKYVRIHAHTRCIYTCTHAHSRTYTIIIETYGAVRVTTAATAPVVMTLLLDTPSAVACSKHTEHLVGARARRARVEGRVKAEAARTMHRPAQQHTHFLNLSIHAHIVHTHGCMYGRYNHTTERHQRTLLAHFFCSFPLGGQLLLIPRCARTQIPDTAA